MKTVTGSYWIPVTFDCTIGRPESYTGFDATQYPPLHKYMEKVIDSMTGKYGNIAAMYYVVEDFTLDDDDLTTTLHVEVVVTSVVAGGAHATDTLFDNIPSDLADTFMELWDDRESSLLIGYDLNPCKAGPDLNVDNGW